MSVMWVHPMLGPRGPHPGWLMGPKRVRGTFGRFLNIAHLFLRTLFNLEMSIRSLIISGGCTLSVLPTGLLVLFTSFFLFGFFEAKMATGRGWFCVPGDSLIWYTWHNTASRIPSCNSTACMILWRPRKDMLQMQ